jgi:hypothetical protein
MPKLKRVKLDDGEVNALVFLCERRIEKCRSVCRLFGDDDMYIDLLSREIVTLESILKKLKEKRG